MSIDKRVWHTYNTYRAGSGFLCSEQIKNRNGKCQRRVIGSLSRLVLVGPHRFLGDAAWAWDQVKHGDARESLTIREAYS